MKFLSLEVALYLYKSTIHPCMKYYCHILAGAPSCYTQTTKTNMQDCWSFTCCFSGIFGPSLKYGQLKSYSIGITLVDVLQNWFNWFHFLFLHECLLVILIDFMIFLSPFLDVTRMSTSTVPFLPRLNILCLWKAFPWPMILMALSPELTDIF